MRHPNRLIATRPLRLAGAPGICAALLVCAAVSTFSATVGATIEPPATALDAERARLLGEAMAVRDGLLRAVGSCREQAAGNRALRADCARAQIRVREAAALEAELRSATGTGVFADRATAATRHGGWSDAAGRLRRELMILEKALSVFGAPPAAERPPAASTAAGPLGAIAGQVTDALTGAPIPDVIVHIFNADGLFVTLGLSGPAGDYVSLDGLPTGTYFARSSNSASYLDELYDDLPCPFLCGNVMASTGIPVTGGGTTSGIDFALDPGGVITGTVTDAGTGDPIADVTLILATSDVFGIAASPTDSTGAYHSLWGLPTGTYFAFTLNSASYLNEIYDDFLCPFFCSPTSGTPISVTQGMTTAGIDFGLTPGGAIAGSITEAGSGDPLPSAVGIADVGGSFVTTGFTDPAGNYVSNDGLPTGSYFAVTAVSSLHFNEVYDDIPCLFGCSATSGTPIPVTVGTTTTGIDFDLAAGGGLAGTVTDAVTGDPIPGVLVVAYDFLGSPLVFMSSDLAGEYSTPAAIPPGTYYARTINHLDYTDELFEELPCLFWCGITDATPITVAPPAVTGGVDFTLAVRPLFFDGFESGGLGIWPTSTGGGACAHSICSTGGFLTVGCDPCVSSICAVDPSCCLEAWDGFCVGGVSSVCSLECP